MTDRASTTGPTATAEAGTKRKRPWLRRVGVVVGCLLAGAIINVLVAWGLVALALGKQTAERGLLSESECAWAIGAEGQHVDVVVPTAFRGIGWEQESGRVGLYTFGNLPPYEVTKVSAGWPYRSLEYLHVTEWGQQSTPFGMDLAVRLGGSMPEAERTNGIRIWRIESKLQGLNAWSIRLPIRPIESGFLINTVFYGAIAWMLFATPRAVRRHRRAKKRQCPACGYPVGTSPVCTECGVAVKRLTTSVD